MTTMLLIHRVGSGTFVMMFALSIECMAFVILFFSGIGVSLGGYCTGRAAVSTSRCSSPGRQPSLSNLSLYLDIAVAVVYV